MIFPSARNLNSVLPNADCNGFIAFEDKTNKLLS